MEHPNPLPQKSLGAVIGQPNPAALPLDRRPATDLVADAQATAEAVALALHLLRGVRRPTAIRQTAKAGHCALRLLRTLRQVGALPRASVMEAEAALADAEDQHPDVLTRSTTDTVGGQR